MKSRIENGLRGASLVKWLTVIALLAVGRYVGTRYWMRPVGTAIEYRTALVERGDLVHAVTANFETVAITNRIHGYPDFFIPKYQPISGRDLSVER